MPCLAEDQAPADWLPRWLNRWSESRLVICITAVALAIRLYLSLTSFCIAADGVLYVDMAREFNAGRPQRALASIFSPLYPWLISLAHYLLPNWELAGDLISAAFGTATVALVYYLIREVFDRRDLAVGAAVLAAFHPDLAAYSASVRTEAGFICLMVAAVYLFIRGIKRRHTLTIAWAGAVGGVAYLYRAEAIGLPMVCVGFLFLGAPLWRNWTIGAAARWAFGFAVPFLVVASPYLVYLHSATGHWIVSRELNLAASSSVMEVARNKAPWQALAKSGNTSILAPLFAAPRAYLHKIGYDVAMSFYYFFEGIEPPVAILLLLGLWARGRKLFSSWAESMLALLVAYYFFGFTLFNTGPRFMVHLIPYTFGWVMVGAEAGTRMLARLIPRGRRLPAGTLLGAVLVAIIPRTLWPLGYDLRGFRYAAADMLRRGPAPHAIVASDGRPAFYAGARLIPLTLDPKPSLCRWLLAHPDADYMMLADREERRLGGNLRDDSCLKFVRRYPRTGSRYYDLFAIHHGD